MVTSKQQHINWVPNVSTFLWHNNEQKLQRSLPLWHITYRNPGMIRRWGEVEGFRIYFADRYSKIPRYKKKRNQGWHQGVSPWKIAIILECECACVCVYVCTHIHIYMYTYIHIFIHTHTHIYTIFDMMMSTLI